MVWIAVSHSDLHDTHTWFSCRDKTCMAMRALSIIAWAAAPSSTVPSSPPPGAGASDCHSSQRCQSAELATAHRPSQKSWAAFVRDSQDLAHTTKPAMAILVAALLVALPSPGLGHACSTPRRRLGSPSHTQRAGIRPRCGIARPIGLESGLHVTPVTLDIEAVSVSHECGCRVVHTSTHTCSRSRLQLPS